MNLRALCAWASGVALVLLWACSSVPSFDRAAQSAGDASVLDAPVERDGGGSADASPSETGTCATFDGDAAAYHVFVTSRTVTGALASDKADASVEERAVAAQAAADSICATAGKVVNACTRWVAFLEGVDDAVSRVHYVPGGFRRVGGANELVFESNVALSGDPKVHVQNDEHGQPMSVNDFVLVGLDQQHRAHPPNPNPDPGCDAWTSATGIVFPGSPVTSSKAGSWRNETTRSCGASLHLYCFEQMP